MLQISNAIDATLIGYSSLILFAVLFGEALPLSATVRAGCRGPYLLRLGPSPRFLSGLLFQIDKVMAFVLLGLTPVNLVVRRPPQRSRGCLRRLLACLRHAQRIPSSTATKAGNCCVVPLLTPQVVLVEGKIIGENLRNMRNHEREFSEFAEEILSLSSVKKALGLQERLIKDAEKRTAEMLMWSGKANNTGARLNMHLAWVDILYKAFMLG